jgi:formylglycine-generating enzyme required for sulfatase activity
MVASPKIAQDRRKRLAETLTDEPLKISVAGPLFLRIVNLVSEIHSAGYLHRELCARNIWQTDTGEVDTEASAPSSNEIRLAGNCLNGDISSLGYLFYETLLGQIQFRQIFPELYREKKDIRWAKWYLDLDKCVPTVKKLIPECPLPLSDLIESMMEKRPERRITSLNQASNILEGLQNRPEEPVLSLPARWRADKQWSLVLAGMALLAMVAWIGRSKTQAREANEFASRGLVASANSLPSSPSDSLPKMVETLTGAMLLIPEGEFVMGSDKTVNESPSHRQSLRAFYIDKTEVNNEMYKQFCDATNRAYPVNPKWDRKYFSKLDYPVMNVSWDDANAYAAWAGKHLPTEAEWEKAARGADGQRYPWGNWLEMGTANLKGFEDGHRYTAPVGSFAFDASPFGVLDMGGNVQEWVKDGYQLYRGNHSALTAEGASWKVVRGGGFLSDLEQSSASWRSSASGQLNAKEYSPVGFRCSASLDAVQKIRRK